MSFDPYAALGGEAGVRALVDAFYDAMDSGEPEVATLRAMHAPDLTEARDKLFRFVSGWTGGPQLYIERYGHPMLRRRHFPFAVDVAARDAWMRCMDVALEAVVEDPAHRGWFRERFAAVADHMVNR
ncbi:MAG: group II truncated hemoglobin [Alphaproteobacteria bacterium]|nr:group II truncated hemoglobin [Alphaproteobacteria bacterium]MCB9693724.1 group II truncated hemoglobin [Alphaproteobacteria bacterium]